MRRAFFAAVLAVAFAASTAAAQQQPPRTQTFKDPGTATLFSVLIPGGGQLYSGETGKGATILGVGLGGFVAGLAVGSSRGVDCGDYSCSDKSAAPILIGSLAYLGAWVYGIVDAGHSAERMNARHGLARLTGGAAPTVARAAGGGTAVGVSLRL